MSKENAPDAPELIKTTYHAGAPGHLAWRVSLWEDTGSGEKEYCLTVFAANAAGALVEARREADFHDKQYGRRLYLGNEAAARPLKCCCPSCECREPAVCIYNSTLLCHECSDFSLDVVDGVMVCGTRLLECNSARHRWTLVGSFVDVLGPKTVALEPTEEGFLVPMLVGDEEVRVRTLNMVQCLSCAAWALLDDEEHALVFRPGPSYRQVRDPLEAALGLHRKIDPER